MKKVENTKKFLHILERNSKNMIRRNLYMPNDEYRVGNDENDKESSGKRKTWEHKQWKMHETLTKDLFLVKVVTIG